MARAITSPELTLLRTPRDWSRLRLAIHMPNVIYSARVNGVPSSNNMVNRINFDGATGTLADIHPGMMMYVGSSAGARDLGEVRLRKAPTSSRFYFGETSSVVWVDNAFLTVVDHFPIRERIVRVSSGATLMDSDVAFSDQHVDFDPVPMLGPHIVAELVDADIDVTLGPPADTPSWVFDSTIDSVLWDIPDATAIDDDTAINPVVTFDSTGWHACYCTVTADNGKSFEGMRYVYIWDQDHLPVRSFKMLDDVSAQYAEGGYSFSVEMYDEAHLDEVRDGALVILFAEDWYGDTKESLGPISGRENIVCIGWIAGETINWNQETDGSVQFSVQGPKYWMEKNTKYSLELLMASNTPDAWNIMPGLTVARAVWHLLHWRFNITQLIDVTIEDDPRMAATLKTTALSVWSQIKDLAWGKIFAQPGCDRYARFWLQIDPQMVPADDRDWDVVQTLTKKDRENDISFERKTGSLNKLCILFSSGEKVDASGNSNVLYSISPGHTPMAYGEMKIIDGLLVADQDQANEQAGLYLGWMNNPYQEIPINIPQNNRMIDLWPRQFLNITIEEEDTPRGVAYSGNLIPRSITLQVDQEMGVLSARLMCEAETFAAPAITGDVPPESGIENFPMGFPPLGNVEFPEPIFEYPPPSETNENHPKKVLIASATHGVAYTENFDLETSKVVWKFMNNGLLDNDKLEIHQIKIAPNGSVFLSAGDYLGGGYLGVRRLYWADSIGAAWTVIYDAFDHPAGADYEWLTGFGVDPNSSEQIAFHTSIIYVLPSLGGTYTSSKLYIGDHASYSSQLYPCDLTYASIREIRTDIVFAASRIFLFGSTTGLLPKPWLGVFDLSGAIQAEYDIQNTGGDPGAARYTQAAGTQDFIFSWDDSGAAVWNEITGRGSSKTAHFYSYGANKIDIKNVQGMSLSPTGNVGMGADAASGYAALVTTDRGATWSPTGGGITGLDVWENCHDDNRWIFGGGNVIALTIDAGATYVSKAGNLGYVAALIDISHIRFIA